MLTRGDRGYARAHYGIRGEDGLTMNPGDPVRFGVYRNALPLKDPNTGEILGYDAQYLGRAQLIRPERLEPVAPPKQRYWWDKFWRPTSEFGEDMIFEFPTGEYAQDHRPISDQSVHTSAHNEARAGDGNLWLSDTDMRVKERTYVQLHPATVDILSAKEDIRPGDRLVAEPVENLMTFIPHVPDKPQEGQIIRIYGDAVVYAGQNQVVVINRGEKDGLEPGHVLQIWRDGMLAQDKTDPARPFVRLPKERNGFMMVFRTFDKLSYALVLQITDAVKAGDRFTNP
jgi:hypothetical protein